MRSIVTRRELLAALAVLKLGFERDLFAAPAPWLRRLQKACADVSARRIPPREWQAEAERLLHDVPLAELVRLVDLDRLRHTIERPLDRAGAQTIRLTGLGGEPAFVTKVFALRRGTAIVPHGHRNMVSLHVVLAGEARLRHYDRVQDEADHLVLRPTVERLSRPGDLSSISAERDNVHWFEATTDVFTLDVIVDNLDPTLPYRYEMDFVDPRGAERMSGGLLRAPRIPFERALRLYGPA
jgi:hypothetical protein